MAVEETRPQADGSGPDLDSATVDDWPERDFPIQDADAGRLVQVVVKQSVLDAIHRHGQSRTDVEVCGVMVGQCYRDERGPFVYVEAVIRGNHSESRTAQVTFTAETWNHIQNEMDRRYDDKRILGWYHTHPGFGIFLSPMDMFIHENFFGANEQLALVYDPLSGDEGLFVWRGGQAVQDPYLVQHDAEAEAGCQGKTPTPPATAAATTPDVETLARRVAGLERRVRWLSVFVYPLVLLVAGWLLLTGFLMAVTEEYPLPDPSGQTPVDVSPLRVEPPPLPERRLEPIEESLEESSGGELEQGELGNDSDTNDVGHDKQDLLDTVESAEAGESVAEEEDVEPTSAKASND